MTGILDRFVHGWKRAVARGMVAPANEMMTRLVKARQAIDHQAVDRERTE